MYDTDPDVKKVVDVAKGLEGLKRSDGIHAAAVVITKEPVTQYLPIQRKPESGQPPEDAPVVTQYEMHGVEDLGLLKMDFLGLRNLDVITDTQEMIRRQPRPGLRHRRRPARRPGHVRPAVAGRHDRGVPARVPADAPAAQGDGAEQLRGRVRVLALYRPGPMSVNMHYDYADRKNGRKPVEYFHDDAKEVLDDTYGLMIYQESVMRVAQKFAGYSLAEADNLRKAWARSPRGDGQGARRVRGRGRANRLRQRTRPALFDIIEKFADYAFNKSHTFGYGLVTYQTAYLKAHYPVEYLACLLTSVKSNLDKAASTCPTAGRWASRCSSPTSTVRSSNFDALAPTRCPGTCRWRSGARVRSRSGCPRCATSARARRTAPRRAGGERQFTSFHDFAERVPEPVLNKRTSSR
jgi:DNA polymerase III subunit alpha